MLRFFFFLTGFGFSTIGFVYIITYLNYLSVGYTVMEYFKMIFTSFECLLALLGIIILTIVVFTKGDKNDIHI